MGIIDHIIEMTVGLLQDYGVAAVFVLMLLESACIPAPSEVIMLFGGFLVSQGDATFAIVVTAGVLGNVVGSLLAWWIGAYGGRTYLERYGTWLHATPHNLDRADRWFARWGAQAVVFSRMLPVVRTFISLPAGVARMPVGQFTLLTLIGCIPWVAGLTFVGALMGPHWERAHGVLHYADLLVIAAVVMGLGLLLHRRWRGRNAGLRESLKR